MSYEFNVEPFWDDFDADGGARDQNYMRILFRPGYAVQARELTQIQSILQNQIKSFGDHIFKSGSPVSGGHLTIDSTAKYLKLEPRYNGSDIDIEEFQDEVILNYSGTDYFQKRAKVIATYESLTSPTLIIKYLGASEFSDNEIIQTPVEYRALTFNSESGGTCSVAHIDEGIFYVEGFFVYVSPQTIVLDPYGVTPSYKIGLEISDHIMDESGDTNLLDPAQESFNYQAPGAHRYQFSLNLAKRTIDSSVTSRFFELMRVENGVVTKKVDLPIYSEFQRTLAKRTYDESGDYVVKPYSLKVSANTADTSNTTLVVEIGAGSSYVKGFPYESAGPQKITIAKAQTKSNVTDYDLPLEYDNYIYANNFISSASGIFDIKQLPTLDLHCVPRANINLTNQTAYSRTYIGSARIVNFDHDESTNYIINLSDINIYANTFTLEANTSASFVGGTGGVVSSTLTVASTNWGTLYPGQYIKWGDGTLARLVVQLTSTTWQLDSAQSISSSTTITAYSTSLLKLPNGFTNLPDAYANVNIKIAGGTPNSNSWIGYTSEIVSYNAVSRIVQLGTDLPTDQLGVYDQITFSYRIDNVDSIVQPGSGYTSILNGMDVADASRYSPNLTKVTDTNKNSLIFPLPEENIASDGFSAMDYYYKLQGTIPSSSIVSGVGIVSLAALTGTSFYYGTNSSDLSSSVANNHFIVVVLSTSGQTPFSAGQPIIFNKTYTYGSWSVTPKITRTSQTSMSINMGASSNVTSLGYICSIKSSNINQSLRTKLSYPTTEITTLRSTDSATLTGAGIVDVDGRRIDSSNGFVWFTDYAKVNKTPNLTDNLYIPDVYKVTAVFDSGDPNRDPTSGATNITDRYYLDSGQNNVYYDHSKLRLKPGVLSPKGRIMAMVKYYKHDSQIGYFTAASYPNIDYQLGRIPIFTTPDGSSYSLRDCIDFRPSRGIGVLPSSSSAFNGMRNPLDTMELSYQYYVPRIDTVVVTTQEGIKILPGTPSKYPSPPINNIGAMEIYRLQIPAYTSDYRKVVVTQISNKRYTMKDIGLLEKRIDNLEYYAALSLAEKAANDKTLQYKDQTQKEKYGIFVDNFSDLRKCDYRNVDFLASVEQFSLRPYVNVNNLNMELYTYDSDIVRVHDKMLTLPYAEVAATKQLAASDVTTISRYSFATFSGQLTLNPEADEWFSTRFKPEFLGETIDNVGAGDQIFVSAAQAATAEDANALSLQPLTTLKVQVTTKKNTTKTVSTNMSTASTVGF